MAILPVDELDANRIKINTRPLVDSNGNLVFDGKVLAKFEELITVHVVADSVEMGLLTPREGDVCKITTTGESFIYSGTSWLTFGREGFSVHTVATSTELDFLSPIAGDVANVTGASTSYIYSGSVWVEILAPQGVVIDDDSVSTTSVWSSSKVNYLIQNHDHDGGTF